jgi:hypothetical protein
VGIIQRAGCQTDLTPDFTGKNMASQPVGKLG